MTFSVGIRAFAIILILEVSTQSDIGTNIYRTKEPFGKGKNVEKRSVLTFPPDSVLQINMGISLAGKVEKNNAAFVLAFQQNAPLFNDSQHILPPTLVVSSRKFSIYDHLKNVIASYGFNGSECLKKMICQVRETPLLGGLMEDVITFVLSPSKHRSIQNNDVEKEEQNYIETLLKSEELGKLGGDCTSAFPECFKTPLDFISGFEKV